MGTLIWAAIDAIYNFIVGGLLGYVIYDLYLTVVYFGADILWLLLLPALLIILGKCPVYLLVVFSACGRIRTGRTMPVLTAYFPVCWHLKASIVGGLLVTAPLENC